MKEHRTINSEWRSLMDAIFPGDTINAIQHDEMKKAFYAGASSALNIMISGADEGLSDEAGAEIFEGLRQEVLEFFRSIKE